MEYYITLREREIEFTDEGLCIMPSGKYIPHLLGLLHLEDRRGRATPSHHGLEVYNKENTMDEEYLNDKGAMTFRSGLGGCLFISQRGWISNIQYEF